MTGTRLQEDAALAEILELLQLAGYRFTTITPESHRRINARADCSEGKTARDVFGWSRPFREGAIAAELLRALAASGYLARSGDLLKSRVRVSSLGKDLYLHSAFPTVERDAVFLGPDTYRFAALLEREVEGARHLVDVGAGSGAGGLSIRHRVERVTLCDVNEEALRMARVNASVCGGTPQVDVVTSDVLRSVEGPIDLIVSNPPYLADEHARAYRDGGGVLGTGLAVRIVDEALDKLEPGGRLVLYSGAPIVNGQDVFLQALAPIADHRVRDLRYVEIDPDVFGEELSGPVYGEVDRIAVVALIAIRS